MVQRVLNEVIRKDQQNALTVISKSGADPGTAFKVNVVVEDVTVTFRGFVSPEGVLKIGTAFTP